MSTIHDIAKDIADYLKYSFGDRFKVVVAYVPRVSPSELNELRCTVAPRSIDTEKESRGSLMNTVTIDVALQKKVSNEGEIPYYDGIAEDVVNSISFWKNGDFEILSVTRDSIFDIDTYSSQSVFTAVLTCNIRYRSLVN